MAEPSAHPVFDRVLGRADLLLFSVSAILTIDTLATAASMGMTWFTWWIITMVLFFVPYGLMTAELGAAWPGEGGLYVWVREALGPRGGSLAAWFYWINNAYWIPSVYMVFAGTFHTIFLKSHLPLSLQEGAGATWLQAAIAIAVTWLTVAVGIVRLQVAKWIPNLGAVVKVAIFVSLGSLGLVSLLLGSRPANDFSLVNFTPNWAALTFLPVLVYNALGFELMSSAGEEMRDPQRDVPRVILQSGLAICVIYILGVAGILIAVPISELTKQTGTWDALTVLGARWGTVGDAFVLVLGVGFLYACVANIVTWSLGVNRVAAAAAQEGALPRVLGRLHPRLHTPYMAFVIMGAIATLLLLGNAAFSSDSSNVFWMMFKLSGLCFLLSYLMVFPAFVILRRRRPDQPRPYRMAGGMAGAWAAAVICWAFIAFSCALFFKPSDVEFGAVFLFFTDRAAIPADQLPAVAKAAWETVLLAGETLATLVAGLVFLPRRAD